MRNKHIKSGCKKGFTLIELSISLVIIGLIVAGTVAGQSLVHTAKLRTILNDITYYKTAYNSFKTQYGSIPGDMSNAYSYWGDASGCTNDDINQVSTGCNGNGNGFIDGPIFLTNGFNLEPFKAWQFLSLSGYINGAYAGTTTRDAGVNMPISKYAPDVNVNFASSNQYFTFFQYSYTTGMIPITQSNFLVFAKNDAGGRILGGFISPKDLYAIDQKFDDGAPQTGVLLGMTGNVQQGGPEDPVVHPCVGTDNVYPFNYYVINHDVAICTIMAVLDN